MQSAFGIPIDRLQLIRDAEGYCAALDEIERLLFSEPDSPEARRLNELVAQVEDYEAVHPSVPDWPVVRVARAA